MIGFLAKIFIKDHNKFTDNAVRKKYGFLTGFTGIFLNVLLCALKIFFGALSMSVSVIADGINNLSDAGSSLITVIGFKISSKPVDKKHPYGHGRMEYVAALLVSTLIIVVGVELVISSVKKIISPEDVVFSIGTLIVLAVSVLVKAYMFVYNFVWGKKLNSAVLRATAFDSIGDAVSTLVVLICALISYLYPSVVLDSYAGIAVACFIITAGVRTFWEIVSDLLGRPPKKDFVESIEKTVLSNKIVTGVHDVIVHDYGPGKKMVSLHAEVPAETDFFYAHECIDSIEKRLEDKFSCLVTIHLDPISNDKETDKLRKEIIRIIHSSFPDFSLHDFRVGTADDDKKTISFDVLAPFGGKETEEEIKEELVKKIKDVYPEYDVILRVDRPFV